MFKKIIISIFLFSLFLPITVLAQETQILDNQEIIYENEEEFEEFEMKEPIESIYLTAVIERTEEKKIKEQQDGFTQIFFRQEIYVRVISKEYKNSKFNFTNEITNNPLDIKVKEGDEIIINLEIYGPDDYKVFLVDHFRLNSLILLVLLFAFVLLLIGGKQGQKTILSLIIAALLIFKVMVPLILKGYNPVFLSLTISLFIVIVTYLLISGWNKKTIIALFGTLGGLVIAIWVSYLFSKLSYLIGLSTEESRTLFFKHPEINPQGVFFAGIIIGALGAVMDVAMSIASHLTELKQSNEKINFNNLFKSGIQVGKDIMGTMSNTLIFAYVGISLPLLLLFKDFGGTYRNFVNLNYVAEEIVRSLGGSIGLITVVPITAIIGAILYSQVKK